MEDPSFSKDLLVAAHLRLDTRELIELFLQIVGDFCLVGVDPVLLGVGERLAEFGEVDIALIEVIPSLLHFSAFI
jgi:hypothetical protein